MKTAIAVLLISSLAWADPPLAQCTEATPLQDQAPDVPGVSVKLRAGEPAPYDARALSFQENCERGKAAVACQAELSDAKTNTWTKPGVIVGMILAAAALGAAAATIGICTKVDCLKKTP